MTIPMRWITVLASATTQLSLGPPDIADTWEGAAVQAQALLQDAVGDELGDPEQLGALQEDLLTQFAELKPERDFQVTLCATQGNATYDWCVSVTGH